MLSLVDSVKTLLILKLPSMHYKLAVVNRNEKEATFLITSGHRDIVHVLFRWFNNTDVWAMGNVKLG